MPDSLRIIVTGLAATYPFGGVFWDYMQFVMGLRRLGHDVLYLEDTGNWCYDPAGQTFVESGEGNAGRLAAELARLDAEVGSDLAGRWFFRDATGRTFGRPPERVADFCRGTDLFLHLSASCWMRDEYWQAKRLAFVDSDPMYTQSSVPDYLNGTADPRARSRVDMIRRHHVHFTFAENIGHADCKIPLGLFEWLPTRQPIVTDCFARHRVEVARRRRMMTTVASWEPTEKGPKINGVQYAGKSAEFQRFIDLPGRSPLPLEVALSGPAPKARLAAAGWRLVEGFEASRDPWVYRDYLANSLGEWSVAKNAYVASRSGWFSCRTAMYLALGVPAVVQDTGFRRALPTGEGVLTFDTVDEAAEGIERIAAAPQRHAAAAEAIAREYFDSAKVLTSLVERAMNSP